jgi:hypothetical protein
VGSEPKTSTGVVVRVYEVVRRSEGGGKEHGHALASGMGPCLAAAWRCAGIWYEIVDSRTRPLQPRRLGVLIPACVLHSVCHCTP